MNRELGEFCCDCPCGCQRELSSSGDGDFGWCSGCLSGLGHIPLHDKKASIFRCARCQVEKPKEEELLIWHRKDGTLLGTVCLQCGLKIVKEEAAEGLIDAAKH